MWHAPAGCPCAALVLPCVAASREVHRQVATRSAGRHLSIVDFLDTSTSPRPRLRTQADEGVTALYAAQGVSLIRMGFVILGDRSAAEDVVQDAFVGLYRNWDRLEDPANALPYVRSSVLNGCRAALRAGARRDRRDRAAAARDGWLPSDPAEAAVLLSEEHHEVPAAVRKLARRQRQR